MKLELFLSCSTAGLESGILKFHNHQEKYVIDFDGWSFGSLNYLDWGKAFSKWRCKNKKVHKYKNNDDTLAFKFFQIKKSFDILYQIKKKNIAMKNNERPYGVGSWNHFGHFDCTNGHKCRQRNF